MKVVVLIIYFIMLSYLVVLFAFSNSHSDPSLIRWTFFSFLAVHVLVDMFVFTRKGKF